MRKTIFVTLLFSLAAYAYKDQPVVATTQLCCDASDNCAPAPPAPGVCPADTITTDCDDDGNCVDQE